MAAYYRAFGLTFQSSEPLPWLPPEPAVDGADVQIEFYSHCTPPEPNPNESLRTELPGDFPSSPPHLSVWQRTSDGRFRFRYLDGTEFTVDAYGRQIRVTWPEGLTIEDAAAYLLGPITGFVLRLRGVVCLHASAVSDAGRALALMAPAGFGKSSSGAVFARWGYTVLTDDILAIQEQDGGFRVLPGWPHLRLWPSSVAALFGRHDALPRLSPTHADWDKRYLDLAESPFRFGCDPVPLKMIYTGRLVQGPGPDHIETLAPLEALKALLANTYSWYALDGAMRAAEFDCLTRIAENVPVHLLFASDPAPARLEERCRAICKDASTMGFEIFSGVEHSH